MAYVYRHLNREGTRQTPYINAAQMAAASYNTHFEWVPETATTTASAPQPTPVTPTFDPKLEANALYGKPMALFAGGFARIGASPAPIVGPYLNSGQVDFIVSFGVAVPVDGDRKIYAIYLDNEKAWTSASGGTLPAHGTFAAEAFDFVFKPGTLTQTVCSLETEKFPGDECAYRPMMLLEIRNLPYARFMANTGKPVPYVACDIGDVTDAADPQDGINVGLGWERIAHSPWAGYSPSTAEYVGVTDVAGAYLLKDNFTVVGLGQIDGRTHRNIDLLQSDKLRLKDRGNVAPDIIFDRDSIIGGDMPVAIMRAGATAQPRELELLAIDPDQDYTVVPSLSKIPKEPFIISAAVGKDTFTSPLVLDANTRQSLVTFAQQYEENARRKISFTASAIGYQVEPGDMAALTGIADGIDSEVWKITQTSHRGDFTVEIEAEAILRCLIGFEPSASAWLGHYEIGLTNAAQSYTGVALGVEDESRVIVIAGAGVTNNRTVTSITIDTGGGPVAMTIHEQELDAGVGAAFHDITTFIASAAVPTGTSATVVVNYSGILDGSFIDVYRLVNLIDPSAPSAVAEATATGASNPTTTIDVPTNGILIGVFAASDTAYVGNIASFGPVTWTGLSAENSDEQISTAGAVWWGSSASQSGMSVQTGRTVAASNVVAGRKSIIVAAWS